jgi:putative sigma-54 modulation protein
MRLSLTGRHVEVTPALRQLVARRLARVERVLNDSVVSASVVLAVDKRLHNVEITIHARGDNMIIGKGAGNGWPQAFAPAIDKLMQQVNKVKGKWVERKRHALGTKGLVNGTPINASTQRARATTGAAADGAAVVSVDRSPGKSISRAAGKPSPQSGAPAPAVRRTKYAVKPMSVEDAALRIEAADEPFVVFRHADTERITILYQRPDGRLGLIDPEM